MLRKWMSKFLNEFEKSSTLQGRINYYRNAFFKITLRVNNRIIDGFIAEIIENLEEMLLILTIFKPSMKPIEF